MVVSSFSSQVEPGWVITRIKQKSSGILLHDSADHTVSSALCCCCTVCRVWTSFTFVWTVESVRVNCLSGLNIYWGILVKVLGHLYPSRRDTRNPVFAGGMARFKSWVGPPPSWSRLATQRHLTSMDRWVARKPQSTSCARRSI